MNKHNLIIFSQNVRKNKTLTNTILEIQKNQTNIILIQEPSHFLIRHILSNSNPNGDPLYGMSKYPDWSLFIQNKSSIENFPGVATYINKHLNKLRFSLCLDVINHRDINIVAFQNCQDINHIINVYSNSNQTAIHLLRNNITDLGKTMIMTGDFNIRDSDWDPNYHHHSAHTEDLIAIANSLGLELSPPTNPGPTRFADNPCDSNSVLDLVFLAPNNPGFGKHSLLPKIQRPLDYVPLLINLGISKENIDMVVQAIKKDSNEEKDFINEITSSIRNLNTTNIMDKNFLLDVTSQLSLAYKKAWTKYSKPKHITKHSKEW